MRAFLDKKGDIKKRNIKIKKTMSLMQQGWRKEKNDSESPSYVLETVLNLLKLLKNMRMKTRHITLKEELPNNIQAVGNFKEY